MMRDVSPFVEAFRTNLEKIRKYPHHNRRLILNADAKPRNEHASRFNIPQASELAAIIPADEIDLEKPQKYRRAIIIQEKAGPLQKINATHQAYDALHYVLFFPYGDSSWTINIPPAANCKKRKRISMREFYAHRIMQRVPPMLTKSNDLLKNENDNVFPTIHFGQKLFQQYIVDNASKIEQERLNFYKDEKVQQKLRIEHADDVFKCISNDPEELKNCGKPYILPQSHKGSPRDNYMRYLNAMAIVRKKGKPDYF